MRPQVTSTYRFQLHAEFPFSAAQAQLQYVASLGVSHVYCSPILAATPGSQHGYDVIDHTRINPDLGGREAFIEFAKAAHELGLGVIVDVVPNHMAFPQDTSLNEPLWLYLSDGPDAATAHWFDVDATSEDGKIALPILGGTLDGELAAGNIKVVDDERHGLVLRYFDTILPLAHTPTTSELTPQQLRDVVEAQHYRLLNWREVERLNYRRFFDVNTLIAIRVERRDVFEATHALLLELHEEGHIDGFRIDHPDGLADPQGYLEQLTSRCTAHTPIWVEKILEPGEELPEKWPCTGTTGYDGLAVMMGALADEQAAATWNEVYQRALTAGQATDPVSATVDAKRFVVRNTLRPEVARLVRLAHTVRPDLTPETLNAALEEVLVHAPVYRAYLRPGTPMTREAATNLDEAFDAAREAASARGLNLASELDALERMAHADETAGHDEFVDVSHELRDFAVRLQQTWGPAMAKSVEDTLFYRWSEMLAVNEVGAGVELIDAHGVARFHDWAQHVVKHWPMTMTTLSTHDTKRSEDVRAALLAMSGDTDGWCETSEAAFALADVMGLDRPMAHLVWQTIAAMGTDVAVDRLHEYLTKAMREAKVFTAWIDGDSAYEEIVYAFATAILTATEQPQRDADVATTMDARGELAWQLRQRIDVLRASNATAITLAGHTQKALQLLAPGVVDTYQGSEAPTLSLVDPDNRRSVDYNQLHTDVDADGTRAHLVQRLLAADVQLAAAPGGGYEPVQTSDALVLAFMRTAGNKVIAKLKGALTPGAHGIGRVVFIGLRAHTRALATPGLERTQVHLPPGTWRHAFSGAQIVVDDGPVTLADLGTHNYGQLHVLIQES